MAENANTYQDAPLTLKEAAQFLRVSPWTIYRWTSKGLLGFFKPNGRVLYFKKADLEAFAFRNRNVPAWEIQGGKK